MCCRCWRGRRSPEITRGFGQAHVGESEGLLQRLGLGAFCLPRGRKGKTWPDPIPIPSGGGRHCAVNAVARVVLGRGAWRCRGGQTERCAALVQVLGLGPTTTPSLGNCPASPHCPSAVGLGEALLGVFVPRGTQTPHRQPGEPSPAPRQRSLCITTSPRGRGGGLGDMPLQRGAGRVSPNSGESRLGTQRAFFAVFHSVPTLLNVSRFRGETFGRFSLRLGPQAGLPRALLTAKKDNQPPSPPSGQQSHF